MKISVILVCCVMLSSCSLRWGYNYLDWIVAWEVEEYIDLTRGQKRYVNKSIDRFHDWHRETQLSTYAEFLIDLERQLLDKETDIAELMQSFDQATDLWQKSLVEFTVFVAPLFKNLSDKQIAELIANTKKETDKAVDKYMGHTQADAQAKQRRHMKKKLKKWVGELTPEQKAVIDTWSLQVTSNHELTIQARQNWQALFNRTLLEDLDSEVLPEQVETLLVYPERQWSDEYRNSVDKNQELSVQLFTQISHTLNAKQKKTLRKKLRGYIKDFQYLAGNS